jgi:hypothetical protein
MGNAESLCEFIRFAFVDLSSRREVNLVADKDHTRVFICHRLKMNIFQVRLLAMKSLQIRS